MPRPRLPLREVSGRLGMIAIRGLVFAISSFCDRLIHLGHRHNPLQTTAANSSLGQGCSILAMNAKGVADQAAGQGNAEPNA